MKFVQTCRLYRGLPNGLQNNNSAKAEGQTAKDRAEQKWVVTRMFVTHTHAGGGVACGARESLPVAGRGRGFSLQLAALGFPPSCLTATTLLAARLAPEFRVGSTGWPSTN